MVKLPKKVMLEAEFRDGTTMWRIPCDCHDPQHDAQLFMEVDEDGFPMLTISTEIGFYHYKKYNEDTWHERFTDWRQRIWKRITIVCKMLFTGYYRMEGNLILDKDSIAGLQYALTEGLKASEKAQEAARKKRNDAIAKEMNGAM
jgi:hypothetical protein